MGHSAFALKSSAIPPRAKIDQRRGVDVRVGTGSGSRSGVGVAVGESEGRTGGDGGGDGLGVGEGVGVMVGVGSWRSKSAAGFSVVVEDVAEIARAKTITAKDKMAKINRYIVYLPSIQRGVPRTLRRD